MIFSVLTLFPELFNPYFNCGVIGKGIEKKLFEVDLINFRDFTSDNYKTVDDYPYGGGDGMILKAEPIIRAFESLKGERRNKKVLITSPAGRLFNQDFAKSLLAYEEVVIICGRYEGIDERVRILTEGEEVSVGGYVLTGGELPALIIIDSVARLVPGVLGSLTSKIDESFERSLLEYPQYTRPEVFREVSVPDVLLSGNHKLINRWRKEKSIEKTIRKRPDLINFDILNEEEKEIYTKLKKENKLR